jgi:D-alanyl-D-alanine carboxypeptidase
VLTIIESGSKAWAVAATNGDVRIFSREQVGEWIEVLMSEDSEQIDADGSLMLEALYEQQPGREPEEDEQPEAEEDEQLEAEADELPEAEADEQPEAEADEQPEAEEDEQLEAEEDEQPEAEAEEKKPRRTRGKTRTRKK